MKRGTKPKPSALRIVTFTGQRPVKPGEPVPTTEAKKPEWLDGVPSKVWDEYAPQLTRLGLLTGLDVEIFSTFCIVAAKVRIRREKCGPNDFSQLRLLGAVFGMGPAERVRLRSDDGQGDAADGTQQRRGSMR